MASTKTVYARVDIEVKEKADRILKRLGISPSSLMQMLYSQIVLRNGLPFELRIPVEPVALGSLSQEELTVELQKGIDSLASGKSYSADEVDQIFKEKYGV
ncbi:type II toxin-antitoxin system RelB/DinJ family antitoxin [Actinotignum schaalii]|uniref:type II toxin-antitoxin system RelB/DinJ family antitoxin n=1 Tax=Actinotignum schaalii TaxID=59505 RepID=UPI00047B9377|nr:type II toxin-antitoxin system RelB/DinJ family antitoxin [Actinotignum schaalii]AIE83155.1 toxin-antitoxin system protein [Actinotignum schaalii]WQN45335.1 type II toxin-antitoxin system RelB/DinJ family antitoxin [Actinotignum schaalii]